jgi:type IV pilus assembly protein PilN
MIKINLIGDRYARRSTRRRTLVLFVSSAFLTVAMSGAAAYYLRSTVTRLQEESRQKQVLSQNVQAMKKRATLLEQQAKGLGPKAYALRDLQRTSGEAIEVLAAISESIPAVAWITELRSYDESVEVTGFAPDDKTIADFVKRLSEQAIFSEVKLARARPASVPDVKGQEYIVRAKIAQDRADETSSEQRGSH